MTELERIAAAMERLAPPPPPDVDLAKGQHFHFDGTFIQPVGNVAILPLGRFVGVARQMAALRQNLTALVRGAPAHDTLLWGARGMGKSALLRSVAAATGIALVEAGGDQLQALPRLFRQLQKEERAFLVYIDDLAFKAADDNVRHLRSLLDGGVEARPDNVRIAVTSNHRHLLTIPPTDSSELRHARDIEDDQLALVDRFGLILGFHKPDQEEYLAMVERHLGAAGLDFERSDALAFARARGGMSGRTAWHYRNEVMARAAASSS